MAITKTDIIEIKRAAAAAAERKGDKELAAALRLSVKQMTESPAKQHGTSSKFVQTEAWNSWTTRNSVSVADIIACKRAAIRAYLRKGDKQNAEILKTAVKGLLGWRRKRTDFVRFKTCPWGCGYDGDMRDHVDCNRKPRSAKG